VLVGACLSGFAHTSTLKLWVAGFNDAVEASA
jgi:hypothetical protein